MKKVLIGLAILCALTFILVTPIIVSLVNMQQVLVDPDAVKEALAGEILIDEVIEAFIRQDIKELPFLGDLPIVIKESEELATALDNFVPEDWANSQSDAVVDSVFLYLESGDFDDLSVAVDLAPIINDLAGEPGRDLVQSSLESLPECGLGNLPKIDLATLEFEITACMPPFVPVDLIATEMHGLMSELLNKQVVSLMLETPLEFNLLDVDPAPREETERKLERVRAFYRFSQAGVFLLWLLPLVLLVLIVVLGVRSVQDFGLWLGAIFLIAAIFSFLLALILRPTLPNLLLASAGSLTDITISEAVINGTMRPILAVLFEKWQARVFLQSGIAFVAGLFFAGIGLAALLVATMRKQQPN